MPERLEWMRKRTATRCAATADRFRKELLTQLGEEKGKAIKYKIVAKTGYTAPREVE